MYAQSAYKMHCSRAPTSVTGHYRGFSQLSHHPLKNSCTVCTYQCQTLRYCAIRNPSMEHYIVGPLLFGILINDLPLSVSHSMPFLYADDVKCLNNNIFNSSRNIDNPQIDHFNVPHPHRAFHFLISFFKCFVVYDVSLLSFKDYI